LGTIYPLGTLWLINNKFSIIGICEQPKKEIIKFPPRKDLS